MEKGTMEQNARETLSKQKVGNALMKQVSPEFLKRKIAEIDDELELAKLRVAHLERQKREVTQELESRPKSEDRQKS